MGEIYLRARFDDLFADIICRVQRVVPGLTDDQARALEQEVRATWAGAQIRIGKRIVHDREQVRELLDAGMARRTAYRKVNGR